MENLKGMKRTGGGGFKKKKKKTKVTQEVM
jgi:hypothetical protein